MKRFLAICLTALLLAVPALPGRATAARNAPAAVIKADSSSTPAPADVAGATGKITFLRVHDVGTGFGPPTDFIDVEAVIQLNTKPGMSFGFQLRNDNNRAARQGMLDLLRDAFNNNWTVVIDYLITPPKKNGVIIRVALTKP
jgi:hypothetical protein